MADNRERALAASPTGDVAVMKAQAIRLDTRDIDSADGRDLLRAYGHRSGRPERTILFRCYARPNYAE